MMRSAAGAVEVALAEVDRADAATAADHERLFVAVMIVRGKARAGLQREEDGRGAALFVHGKRFQFDAGKWKHAPSPFVGAHGAAVLRYAANRVDDTAAQLGRRRDGLDRFGHDGVEHLNIVVCQNVRHVTSAAQRARAVLPFPRRSYAAIPILPVRSVRAVRQEWRRRRTAPRPAPPESIL